MTCQLFLMSESRNNFFQKTLKYCSVERYQITPVVRIKCSNAFVSGVLCFRMSSRASKDVTWSGFHVSSLPQPSPVTSTSKFLMVNYGKRLDTQDFFLVIWFWNLKNFIVFSIRKIKLFPFNTRNFFKCSKWVRESAVLLFK